MVDWVALQAVLLQNLTLSRDVWAKYGDDGWFPATVSRLPYKGKGGHWKVGVVFKEDGIKSIVDMFYDVALDNPDVGTLQSVEQELLCRDGVVRFEVTWKPTMLGQVWAASWHTMEELLQNENANTLLTEWRKTHIAVTPEDKLDDSEDFERSPGKVGRGSSKKKQKEETEDEDVKVPRKRARKASSHKKTKLNIMSDDKDEDLPLNQLWPTSSSPSSPSSSSSSSSSPSSSFSSSSSTADILSSLTQRNSAPKLPKVMKSSVIRQLPRSPPVLPPSLDRSKQPLPPARISSKHPQRAMSSQKSPLSGKPLKLASSALQDGVSPSKKKGLVRQKFVKSTGWKSDSSDSLENTSSNDGDDEPLEVEVARNSSSSSSSSPSSFLLSSLFEAAKSLATLSGPSSTSSPFPSLLQGYQDVILEADRQGKSAIKIPRSAKCKKDLSLTKDERKLARREKREQMRKNMAKTGFVPLSGVSKIPKQDVIPSPKPETTVSAVSSKPLLLVGDGDLSFTVAVAGAIGRKTHSGPLEDFWKDMLSFDTVVTSSILPRHKLEATYEFADKHILTLEKTTTPNCSVIYELDATQIRFNIPLVKKGLTFECVVFNFPLVGHDAPNTPREEYFEGNRKLLREFFANVGSVLRPGATVRVTLCNRQEVEFELHKVAQQSLFYCVERLEFDESLFPEYRRKRATSDSDWDIDQQGAWTSVFKLAGSQEDLKIHIARFQSLPRKLPRTVKSSVLPTIGTVKAPTTSSLPSTLLVPPRSAAVLSPSLVPSTVVPSETSLQTERLLKNPQEIPVSEPDLAARKRTLDMLAQRRARATARPEPLIIQSAPAPVEVPCDLPPFCIANRPVEEEDIHIVTDDSDGEIQSFDSLVAAFSL